MTRRCVCRFGNPNAAADAVVGATLILAALESAGLNVDVNLPGVTDGDYVRASADERQSLQARARVLRRTDADLKVRATGVSVNLVEHP